MGVFANKFVSFFCNLPNLSPFFCFANLSRFNNGCCIWNIYKGLRFGLEVEACTCKELELIVKKHNTKP